MVNMGKCGSLAFLAVVACMLVAQPGDATAANLFDVLDTSTTGQQYIDVFDVTDLAGITLNRFELSTDPTTDSFDVFDGDMEDVGRATHESTFVLTIFNKPSDNDYTDTVLLLGLNALVGGSITSITITDSTDSNNTATLTFGGTASATDDWYTPTETGVFNSPTRPGDGVGGFINWDDALVGGVHLNLSSNNNTTRKLDVTIVGAALDTKIRFDFYGSDGENGVFMTDGQANSSSMAFTVPEPGTLAMCGAGLLLLAGRLRKRKKRVG